MKSSVAEGIACAGLHGRLRTEDHKAEMLLLGEVHESNDVGRCDGDVPGHPARSAVARRAEDALHQIRLNALPNDGVLARTGSDYENLHSRRYWITNRPMPRPVCIYARATRPTGGIPITDYRTSWRQWARKNYEDAVTADIAAQAAITAIEEGGSQADAARRGHLAAIDSGAEYICRPDRVGMALAACILFGAMFIPAATIGAISYPSLEIYALLMGFVAVFALAIIGLLMVRKNSCFFVARNTAGRRNWRGHVVSSVSRIGHVSVDIHRGRPIRPLMYDEPDESTVSVSSDGRGSILSTALYWWTSPRIGEFALVLGTEAG